MAIKYLSHIETLNINMQQNELQFPKIHSLSAAPSTPVEGQIYYNSSAGVKTIYVYNGTGWVPLAPGDITSITSATTNQLIVSSGLSGDTILTIVTGSINSTSTALATGSQIYSYIAGLNYSTTVGTVTSVAATGADGITVTGSPITSSGTLAIAIANGGIANIKLANSTITIGTTTIALGATSTSLAGLTSLDFAAGDRNLGASIGANNLTIGGSSSTIVIPGNLTVNGTTTTINTETILLADNIITLNSNYTGSTPTENSGIEVERGTLTNVSVLWNESSDRWTFTNDGTTFYNIPVPAEYNFYVHPTQTAINVDATNNGINVIDSVVVNTLGHVTAVTTRDLSNATTSAAGVMSAADKTKLDGIATGANLYVHPAYTTVNLNGGGLSFVADITVDAIGSVTAVSLDTIQSATEAQLGVIELATQTEVNAGTDTTRAVTPATLSTYVATLVNNNSYAATISVSGSVIHGLNTRDVIVQLYDTVTFETVYATITRTSTTTVNVGFDVALTNPVRVLVSKVD